MDFQPVVRSKLNKLTIKIEEYVNTDRVLPLHRAWTAFSGDIVTEFCFANAYDHLDSPDFKDTFHEGMHAACESSNVLMQFPWLWPIMNSLPDWLVLKLEPTMYVHIQVQKVVLVIIENRKTTADRMIIGLQAYSDQAESRAR